MTFSERARHVLDSRPRSELLERSYDRTVRQVSAYVPAEIVQDVPVPPETRYFLTCNLCSAVYVTLEKSTLHERATGHTSFKVYAEVVELDSVPAVSSLHPLAQENE